MSAGPLSAHVFPAEWEMAVSEAAKAHGASRTPAAGADADREPDRVVAGDLARFTCLCSFLCEPDFWQQMWGKGRDVTHPDVGVGLGMVTEVPS